MTITIANNDSPAPVVDEASSASSDWHDCRFLTCSVLPVRVACNLACPFCFSKSSISSLKFEAADWRRMDVETYYEYSRSRGANRLVITGGGEPLLRPREVVSLVRRGRAYFDEIALFTNGARLTSELSRQLAEAGLSYLCYSRHHHLDQRCRQLMGDGAPRLADFVTAAGGIPIRATCVMTRGWIDSRQAVDDYLAELARYGIREFTFKHTYVAYEQSLFADSPANDWSRRHRVDDDPFTGRGEVVGELPWGPRIRQLDSFRVCYYFEPTPVWELENRLCRSTNLLSDGAVYASLEDQRSRLFRLNCS
ncbi:MAG: radical SAM protein [Pirellulaceae bacterium]